MCLVSLVLDIRLNILTFTYGYGSLILLQLPLQNTGWLLLRFIISGPNLHAWLIIEIQLNGVVLTKLDKNINAVENINY